MSLFLFIIAILLRDKLTLFGENLKSEAIENQPF